MYSYNASKENGILIGRKEKKNAIVDLSRMEARYIPNQKPK